MATRKVPDTKPETTEHDPSGTGDPQTYQTPPPMEEGDPRRVPQVGGDPENPETNQEGDFVSRDLSEGEVPVSVSAFGMHIGSGVRTDDMEVAPDGWDRNADGSMTPNTVPWVGY